MNTVDLPMKAKELKEAVDSFNRENDEDRQAYYHGPYHGRWYHKGVAISFPPHRTATMMRHLISECHSSGHDGIPDPDQIDNMGLDILWSWNVTRFEGDIPEADEE